MFDACCDRKTAAWPAVPQDELGRTLTKAEEESILGYGSEGV